MTEMYWNTAKLTEVVRINPRNVDFALDDSDEVTFLPMAGVEAETGRINISERRTWKTVKKGYTKFQENDVLVAKITPCMENGKACIARHLHGAAGAGSTEFHVFRPNTEIIEPEWLYLFLNQQRIRSAAKRQMGGAVGQQRVPASFYESLVLPLPDIEKQRELLECLIGQGVRITHIEEELRSVLKKLKQARASILKAAVEGRLVETEAELARIENRKYEHARDLIAASLKLREQQHESVQQTQDRKRTYRKPTSVSYILSQDASLLPPGWAYASTEEVTTGNPYSLAIGPFGSNLKVSDYKDRGVPLVFVRNVRSNIFSVDNAVFVSQEKANELKAHAAEPGDLLITKMGDPPGDSAIYPSGLPRSIITADVLKLNPSDRFAVQYLLYATKSSFFRLQIQLATKGVAQKKVSLERFSKIYFPIPPYAEQVRIVNEIDRRFSVLDQVEATVHASLARCGKLRQAILKRVFGG